MQTECKHRLFEQNYLEHQCKKVHIYLNFNGTSHAIHNEYLTQITLHFVLINKGLCQTEGSSQLQAASGWNLSPMNYTATGKINL